MKAILSLLGYLCIGYLLVRWTYKIGAGLDYWWPFIAVVFGLVVSAAFYIVEAVRNGRSGK